MKSTKSWKLKRPRNDGNGGTPNAGNGSSRPENDPGNGPTTVAQFESIYGLYSVDLTRYARRWGFGPEDAEDLTQEFFLRILTKDSIRRFDSRKGCLRTYVLALFQRFLTNYWHGLRALKRGGSRVSLPLNGSADFGVEALVDWRTPERLAQLHWARELLDNAVNRMRKELARKGKASVFDALLPHLLNGPDRTSKNGNGLPAPVSVRMTLSRYRARLKILISEEAKGKGSNKNFADDQALGDIIGL